MAVTSSNATPGVRPEIVNTDTWEYDYEHRVNPKLMTRLLHQSVPVLQWTRWRITDVRRGYCESMLPLSVETTNQHGTHQAALISLSADYTGGMALTTLLHNTPLTGIHRGSPEESASLWLVNMDVKYEQPSTSHLYARCRIDENTSKRITSRYFSGRVVLATLTVEFWSKEDERIAVAEMRYFAQATKKLLEKSENGENSPLAKLNLKTSARIIAGLRATGASSEALAGSTLRIDHPHDFVAAGTQGMLQADRLRKVLPQLGTMVLARTRHCDETIRSCSGVEQVVMLGAGLDMRPLRLGRSLRDATIFEIDLPEMLEERRRVVDRLKRRFGSSVDALVRHQIPADFVVDEVGTLLESHPAFSTSAATFVIYEGCSMYFTESQNARILSSMSRLLTHPDSLIWMDCVTPAVIDGSTPDPNIHEFVDRMELIGERFIYGPSDPERLLRSCGFTSLSSTTAGEFFNDHDPTLSEYRFIVGRQSGNGPAKPR